MKYSSQRVLCISAALCTLSKPSPNGGRSETTVWPGGANKCNVARFPLARGPSSRVARARGRSVMTDKNPSNQRVGKNSQAETLECGGFMSHAVGDCQMVAYHQEGAEKLAAFRRQVAPKAFASAV